MKKLFCLFLIIVCTGFLNAQDGRLIPSPLRKIPKWVREEFFAKKMDARYSITFLRHPPYLKGDFNGDGLKDIAIQIEEQGSRKNGIAIFHAKKPQVISTPVTILGAGKPLGAAGDDFRLLDMWRLSSKQNSPELKKTSEKSGDAIAINKRGTAGGFIYRDGKKYAWLKSTRKQP